MAQYDHELGIIGAGPAGLSAAVYGKRAGLDVVIFDTGFGGGTVTINPMVENYLGMDSIPGFELAAKMQAHAEKYVEIIKNEPVSKLEISSDAVKIVTDKRSPSVGALVFATGTENRRLGVTGEGKFLGRGVSYCATCDGPFFRNKRIGVVGGGNSAAIEALYLKGLSEDVSLIHRRDQLRAEDIYTEQLKKNNVKLILNSTVEEIYGDEVLKGVKLLDKLEESTSELELDGIFISIGTIPRSELAKDIGVELDEGGYIKVDRGMRTNIDRVYAAGDVIGGVRQIVVAAAEGATAALESLRVLGKQYPF